MARDAVVDACALSNLTATGEEVRIAEAVGLRLVAGPQARAEVVYHVGAPDDGGLPTKEPVDLTGLESAELLRTRERTSESAEAFVRAAERLTDADAESVAIAVTMQCPLVTDDGKVRSVVRALFPDVTLLSTLELLRDAATALELTDARVRDTLRRLRDRGNFAPPRSLPESSWYRDRLSHP